MVRPGAAPAPVRATWGRLLDGSCNADLVTVQARLVDWAAAGDAVTLILQAEDQLFRANLPPLPAGQSLPEKHSVVEATGICVSSERDDRSNQSPRTFRLLLSSPADIVVLQRPDWWTPERLGRGLAAVLVLLAIGLGWVWSLRRQRLTPNGVRLFIRGTWLDCMVPAK